MTQTKAQLERQDRRNAYTKSINPNQPRAQYTQKKTTDHHRFFTGTCIAF